MTLSEIINTKSLRKVQKRAAKLNWQESYSGLILAAIVTVVLGLLVANYFTRSRGEIGTADVTTQSVEAANSLNKSSYVVAPGDSLSIIANKVYGDMELWPAIAKANNITNADVIFADTRLTIPQKSEAETLKAQATVTSYQINAGDTLFTIAEKVYGDGSKWQIIDTANHVGRLPNGNPLIFAGNNLVIPR